jgi:predicted dienelactone hydrolase
MAAAGEPETLGRGRFEIVMPRVTRLFSAWVALVLSTGVLAQVRPTLPPPTGSLAVGRLTYDWTDSARAETLSPPQSARREIKVHVWYPAAPAQARRPMVPYIDSFPSIMQAVSRQALEGLFRPASYAVLERSLPATHTVEGAAMPATRDKYPVLLFSHGLGNTSELYTAEIEDLVSHGYVVAAINHTYDAAFVVFPGDRVVVYARQTWQDESQKPNGYVQYVRKRIEEAWVPDLRFVLGQLERLDAAPSSFFSGRLDLTRVGAFGHSMGGLAIVRACQLESRLLAS